MWPGQVFWKVHSALEVVASGAEADRQEQVRNHNVSLKFISFSSFSLVKRENFCRIRVLLSCTIERTFGILLINEFDDGIDLDKI